MDFNTKIIHRIFAFIALVFLGAFVRGFSEGLGVGPVADFFLSGLSSGLMVIAGWVLCRAFYLRQERVR